MWVRCVRPLSLKRGGCSARLPVILHCSRLFSGISSTMKCRLYIFQNPLYNFKFASEKNRYRCAEKSSPGWLPRGGCVQTQSHRSVLPRKWALPAVCCGRAHHRAWRGAWMLSQGPGSRGNHGLGGCLVSLFLIFHLEFSWPSVVTTLTLPAPVL